MDGGDMAEARRTRSSLPADADIQHFRKRQLVRRDTAEYLAYVHLRGPHPGYELLAPEQVAAWVKDHYGRAGGEQHIPRVSQLGDMGLAGQRAAGGFRGQAAAWDDGVYSGLGECVAERGVHVGG